MQNLKGYIPQIILCGEVADFFALTKNKPAKIIGKIEFNSNDFDAIKDKKALLNGKIISFDDLKKICGKGLVDYVVFTRSETFYKYLNTLNDLEFPCTQFCTANFFLHHVKNNFFSIYNETKFYSCIDLLKLETLLDFDGTFSKNFVHCKPHFIATRIDGILTEEVQPFQKNIYTQIYKTVAECCLKNYSAVMFSAERTIEEFINAVNFTNDLSENIIVIARFKSEVNEWLMENGKKVFENMRYTEYVNIRLFFLQKKRKRDFSVYIAAHKKVELPNNLPSEYHLIHAGHALAEDLGFPGDDTGQNISVLNPYLNELTVLYWMWKNSATDFIGLAHYRRFLTVPKNFSQEAKDAITEENILTPQAAKKFLEKYDIILGDEFFGYFTQTEHLQNDVGEGLAKSAISLTEKMLSVYQPEYLSAFNEIINSCGFYRCNIFVTRRHVFNAFCSWLFSFILPALKEILTVTNLEELDTKSRRTVGFIAERMLSVWLIKNNLRIVELPILTIK